jgi:alpha-D-xyloside xylohydrolase
MRGYRYLTGATPLPPKWAFGYVQSKERYVTAREMIDVVAEYRRRRVPLDCIVLDWKSWPNGEGWGQKSFDPMRFPDPEDFTEKLHELGAKLMVSIWPIMTGGCENQRELGERGLMLGNQSTYNAFLSEARACYWEQAQRGLFAHGVDAWWCDCTEPFEADWSGAVKLSLAERLAINTDASTLYLDAGEINTYSLVHSQGIYEGQRGVSESKRVLNLTRSSYAGQHRYGTFTWNGDVSATWETLRRCIPEGVNVCATGEAYWTVDAGGFFVDNKPDLWFWRGAYPGGCRGSDSDGRARPGPQRYRFYRSRLLGTLYPLAAVRSVSADVPFARNRRAA